MYEIACIRHNSFPMPLSHYCPTRAYQLSHPSSSPPSRGHAWCTLCDSLCIGSMPTHWPETTYSDRSKDCAPVSVCTIACSVPIGITYLWMLVRMAATSYVGYQRFCRISRHNSPVPYTLGWNIWLINLTAGGLLGYASSKCITRRNVPSSKGVSAGPMMTAFLSIC